MTAINIAFAQTKAFEINSVIIEGTLYEFSAKLEAQGMQIMDADFGKGYSMFSGSYESFEDCSLVVNADDAGMVKSLNVMLRPQEKGVHAVVNDVYKPVKEMLRTKYGVPVAEIEDFSGLERDIRKRVKEGKAATTQFMTAAGNILVGIGYERTVGGYFVVVVYDLKS